MVMPKMPKMPKNAEKYICKECDFKCSKYSNYNTHLSTRKHQMITNGNLNDNIKMKKNPKLHLCDCGKKYNFASGLSRHKLTCKSQDDVYTPNVDTPNVDTPNVDTPKEDNKDNVINLLLADNKEMKEMFVMFFKTQMESQSNTNKMITGLHENQYDMTKKIIQEVLPLVGNDHHKTTTNSHNNTLNFY